VEDTYKSLAAKVGLFACTLGVLCPIAFMGTISVSLAHEPSSSVNERTCEVVRYTDPVSSGFLVSMEQPLGLTAEQIEEALQAVKDPVFSDADISILLPGEIATTVCNCQCECECACACACTPGTACNCAVCNCDCYCGACAAVCACACSCTTGPCSCNCDCNCSCNCNCCGGKYGNQWPERSRSVFRL
jgi:hypothetical protein